jgi:hypothetical protein
MSTEDKISNLVQAIISVPDNKPEHAADHKAINISNLIKGFNHELLGENRQLREYKRLNIIGLSGYTTEELHEKISNLKAINSELLMALEESLDYADHATEFCGRVELLIQKAKS